MSAIIPWLPVVVAVAAAIVILAFDRHFTAIERASRPRRVDDIFAIKAATAPDADEFVAWRFGRNRGPRV